MYKSFFDYDLKVKITSFYLMEYNFSHFETENYEVAIKLYNDALRQFKNDNKSTNIKIRILYNLAKALTRKNRYQESITKCNIAIQHCVKNHLMYLLGELHYHIGYNYMIIKEYEKVLVHYENSISIFRLQGNMQYIKHIEEKTEEISTRSVK